MIFWFFGFLVWEGRERDFFSIFDLGESGWFFGFFPRFFCFSDHFWPAQLLAHTTFGPDRLLAQATFFYQTVLCPNFCEPSLTPKNLGQWSCSSGQFVAHVHGPPCAGPPLPKTTLCGIPRCVVLCVQNFHGCVQDLCVPSDCPSPSAGPPPPDRPNFRSFFPSPATIFILSSSPGGRFVEFWRSLKRRDPQLCTFGVLELSCETRAALDPPGFQSRRFKHRQNSTKRPPGEEQRMKIVAGEGKNSAKFWALQSWGLHPWGPQPSGPPPFLSLGLHPSACTLRASILRGPTVRDPTLRGPTLRGPTLRGPPYGAPPFGALCGAHPPPDRLKFRFFFPLPPPCSLFLSLSGGLLVEFWWCFGLSGCRVKQQRLSQCQEQFYNWFAPPLRRPKKTNYKMCLHQRKNIEHRNSTGRRPSTFGTHTSGPSLFLVVVCAAPDSAACCCFCCCLCSCCCCFCCCFWAADRRTPPLQCLTFKNCKNNFTIDETPLTQTIVTKFVGTTEIPREHAPPPSHPSGPHTSWP